MEKNQLNKTALITGASTGIGSALARQLASAGYNLILMARRQSLLNELKNTLQKERDTSKIVTVESDVSEYERHMQDIKKACAEFQSLDLVIANAGIGRNTVETGNTWSHSHQIYAVNLLGALATIETCKDIMLKQGFGHIVGISSVAATRGITYSSAYCASKAALTAHLESMRIDLVGRNIAVTAIHPGFVATPMSEKNGKMPFVITADDAAQRIMKAINRKKARHYFPWQMGALVWFMRVIPNSLYDLAMKSTRKKIEVFRQDRG